MKTFRMAVLQIVGLIYRSKFVFLFPFGVESDLFITLMVPPPFSFPSPPLLPKESNPSLFPSPFPLQKLFFEFKWNNIIHCQVTDIYRSFFLSKQNELIELVCYFYSVPFLPLPFPFPSTHSCVLVCEAIEYPRESRCFRWFWVCIFHSQSFSW